MDYDGEFAGIRDESNQLALDTRRLNWALQRTIATTIKRVVGARFESLKKENEAIRRLPRGEQDRIQREMFEEESAARQLDASVMRHRVEPRVEALERRHQSYVMRRRADTSLNFPKEAFNGFGPADMVTLSLYRETRRAAVENAAPAELFKMAQSALQSQSAVGFVDFGLVEERVDRGGLSRTPDDVPIVKQLVEFVEAFRDLRVEPIGLLDVIANNVREAQKTVARAELAQVQPINAEHDPRAKDAFEMADAEWEAEAAGQ
jgi:hypothetical protein